MKNKTETFPGYKPVLGGEDICSLLNYIVAYKET